MNETNAPSSGSAACRLAQTIGKGGETLNFWEPDPFIGLQKFKKIRRIDYGFRGETRMKVLDQLTVAAPSAKGQVAGPDEQMRIVRSQEPGQLRMEHSSSSLDRNQLIIAPD